MATDQVLFKADKKFISEIDATVKSGNYQNRTEFIREALRDKIDEYRLKEAISKFALLKGSLRKSRQTNDEDLEATREKVFQEFEKKFKQGHLRV